ncbi:hypothetical protein BCR37DRAFT_162493 [Protomyces lactucae-debilis]|uniref:Uncharacterized protein n=1 Tax=Protomyces lactucae-debilis TaxID=2754530 RepID=A0A1Y2EZF1_PROLT|nr:uncharacterized protein BCR37DRAFT_162493 [Protomyces lactucae-debilis]ORY76644.1 hypothetical protein BCR37DRAFT_162493 [Protomyces lactucae-debilis]
MATSPAADYIRYQLLLPTLLFCSGLAVGSILAVQRNASIPVYAARTGINFTLMGGTFVLLRQAGLASLQLATGTNEPTRTERVGMSGLSGALTGLSFNLFTRGTRGLTGAILLYGSMAATGQLGLHAASDARAAYIAGRNAPTAPAPAAVKQKEGDKSVWQKLKESSPMRRMSDDEYEALIAGRIEELDGQLGLVEEEIQFALEEIRRRQEM